MQKDLRKRNQAQAVCYCKKFYGQKTND